MADFASPDLPTLAVVVPALNEARQLPRLLDSLRTSPAGAAADSPDEVIVVDGGSADGTAGVAERAGARTLGALRGRGAQQAAGAAATDAEVLLFLHADCAVAPGAVSAVRRAFLDPALVATGMRQRIGARGWLYRAIERAADGRVRLGWIYGDSGLAVRRSAYDAVGGFKDQPLFEDLDLSRRLRRYGKVSLVQEARVEISSRRWEREGPLRRTLCNWLLTAGWVLGVAPARLERYYQPRGRAEAGGPVA